MMAGFAKRERQAVIDEYLNATGRNSFIPAEFLDWLGDRPDHPVYNLFFGMDDEAAARSYRVDMVRSWVSGLRISVQVQSQTHQRIGAVSVRVRECTLPAMISPIGGRKSGGGYQPVDPENSEHLAEIYRQAAVDLARWIERYEGAMLLRGADLSMMKQIVAELEAAGSVGQAA